MNIFKVLVLSPIWCLYVVSSMKVICFRIYHHGHVICYMLYEQEYPSCVMTSKIKAIWIEISTTIRLGISTNVWLEITNIMVSGVDGIYTRIRM